MAQKTTGQEETEFQVAPPENTLTLCVNNCGFTGNPATKNMCQKCFKPAPPPETSRSRTRPAEVASPVRDLKRSDLPAPAEAKPAKREVNRCSGCRKKVGLTGFRCRCGELFCSGHRYSDRHDCSFDYKAAGREAIARENPIVKAAKIIKL